MQPENITTQPTNGVNTEKSKMSKKQIIGLVVLSLVAVGGVLFGIYGMNSQNEQIAELKGQVSSANEELAKLDTEIDESDKVMVEDEVEAGDDVVISNSNGYIYVGEWGLKIKIPEELRVARYKYDCELGSDPSSLCIMAYKERAEQNSPSFVDNGEYLTCVSRVPKDSSPYGSRIMTDRGHDYMFNNATTYYSNGNDSTEWEKESRELMFQVFGNSENYSTITNLSAGGN